jgi:hypothetical protein
MYVVCEIRRVLSSSLVKSIPKWNEIGQVPFSLNLCCFSRISISSLGSFIAMARSSTYTAMYSYQFPFFLTQISGSVLHGKNPISQIQSTNQSCHLAPLLHSPYSDLLMMRIWPSRYPISGFLMYKLQGMHCQCLWTRSQGD